jgi:hypothetical protein
MSGTPTLSGRGRLKHGSQDFGQIEYEIETTIDNGQATIVKFARKPPGKRGERLHLTLQDGRMLDCFVLDGSPYCAVVGDGPYTDRRRNRRR